MSGALTVLEAGVLTTVQDRGRRGLAHLGVPRAGALDRPAAELALRLLGEEPGAALLEVTLGGLELRLDTGRWIAVTGAPGEVRVDGRAVGHGRAEWVAAGATVRLGPPRSGVRSYVAVAGGIAVDPVLGSRSTDTLAGVGPPVVTSGAVLPLGRPTGTPRSHDTPRPRARGPLRLVPGPRADWLAPDAVERLCGAPYTVAADSNRVGLRLEGPALPRARAGELASEGMVLGAVQVPPSGTPVVFLADHPPTGGYPVVGVVLEEDLWQCAQLRPGEEVRFTPAGPRPAPRGSRR
jgi:biotin-dependent carboxylase-like uncharacterized protein